MEKRSVRKPRVGKKIIGLMLVSILMFMLMPSAAFADWVLESEGESYKWYIVDGEFLVEESEHRLDDFVLIGYLGTSRDVVIPDGVTATTSGILFIQREGENAGEICDLLSVVFPASVTGIINDCFNQMPNLSSVTILNPDAGIGNRVYPFFNPDDETDVQFVELVKFNQPGLTIYSYPGGAVEEYAKKHNINFVSLEDDGATTTSPLPIEPPILQLPTLTVIPTPSNVYVNGELTAFEAYNIGGNNYFKLRDLAFILGGTEKQFSVGYDNESRAITLTSSQPYEVLGSEMMLGDGTAKSATLNETINISKDGVPVEITAYLISDNNFMKLRDVMRLLDVGVGYDNDTGNITIDTSQPYVED